MKVKTSISLSEDLVRTIDEVVGEPTNRSSFLETAAWAYIADLRRAQQAMRDIEIIDRRAAYLNTEVMDSLGYQAVP